MVKAVYFILPPGEGMASTFVRAECLDGFAPLGWKFVFISGPIFSRKCARLLRRILTARHYIHQLIKIKSRENISPAIYFIKPSSFFLLLFSRFVLRLKTFIDINDPLHLPEFLGSYSRLKLRLLMLLANGIVFESSEYMEYCKEWVSEKCVLIEDTPQFEVSYTDFSHRELAVVWFGSPGTSHVLLDYSEYLKVFAKYGYKVILLGASYEVVMALQKGGMEIKWVKQYDHQILIDIVSSATFSFVPMPDIEAYALRGNLKAKLSMACGCLTIASNLKMHLRLIDNRVNGYIFDGIVDLEEIISEVSADVLGSLKKIGASANLSSMKNYNRTNHAEKICSFFDSHIV